MTSTMLARSRISRMQLGLMIGMSKVEVRLESLHFCWRKGSVKNGTEMMGKFKSGLLCCCLTAVLGFGGRGVELPAAEGVAEKHATVWQARVGGGADDYLKSVEMLVEEFEKSEGRKLIPGEKHKVGLKIYTDSGAGLATPVQLTLAVIAALEKRGWTKGDIFLVGLSEARLREAGYLPSFASGRSPFEGHKIYVLESGRYFDPVWYYDSPLPSRFDPITAQREKKDIWGQGYKGGGKDMDDDRKSFLATPLFVDTDFWINLPVYSDHPRLGVNGALVNATLWNASNTDRFLNSAASAPAAVAEMSAIPELRGTWMFTVSSLERYQFIGGPIFNSFYTVSEPVLWLSGDPVAMDALMLKRIDTQRELSGFKPVSKDIRMLDFAESLGVGVRDLRRVEVVPVDLEREGAIRPDGAGR